MSEQQSTPSESASTAASGKNYVVILSAYSNVVVVNANDEGEAMELAMDAVSTGDFNVEDARVVREIKTPEDLARSKRHADCVADD